MAMALQGMSAFGAVLHVSGSVLIVYGQTIVKVAHCIEESSASGSTWYLPAAQQQLKWRRPDGKWRRQLAGSKSYAAAGWVMFAVGNLMRFISMRFAAQTVLSGLGSLQFVVIPIASRFLLGIQPQLSTLVGVITVLLGNFLIIMYGPPEVTFTLPQLRAQWTTPPMRAFLLVLGVLLVGLHMIWRHLHRIRRKAEARAALRSELQNLDSNGAIHGGGTHFEFSTPSKPPPLPSGTTVPEVDPVNTFIAALLFSAVASFIGAWSVLFSKSLTYVFTAAPASLFDWYSWFTMLAFLGSAAYWIHQSNKGLKLYPATLIMPLMQAFWMCMSVLEGMIYFDEMAYLPSTSLGLLLLGLVMALIGAVAMGLAGYFNEQPQILALAMSPTGLVSPDVESQRLLGSHHAHKNSGVPLPIDGVGETEGLVEIGGRVGGLSCVILREKSSGSRDIGSAGGDGSAGGSVEMTKPSFSGPTVLQLAQQQQQQQSSRWIRSLEPALGGVVDDTPSGSEFGSSNTSSPQKQPGRVVGPKGKTARHVFDW